MPVVHNSISWRKGSDSSDAAIDFMSSVPVDPGRRGSSLGGGITVTVCLQRGHSTLNGSVGSRSSSKVKLIAHCGQLAIISSLQSSLYYRSTTSIMRCLAADSAGRDGM